jgi:hypothetical protein
LTIDHLQYHSLPEIKLCCQIKIQVLIGCEGTYSVVAKYLGLSPVRTIPRPVLRGFTWYPHGHSFDNEFLRLRVGDFFIGRLTITDNLVHFFITMPKPPTGIQLFTPLGFREDMHDEHLARNFMLLNSY